MFAVVLCGFRFIVQIFLCDNSFVYSAKHCYKTCTVFHHFFESFCQEWCNTAKQMHTVTNRTAVAHVRNALYTFDLTMLTESEL